jgi:ZIP family zinc transporter
VSTAQILLLGAIAGFTIYLGLPIGRVTSKSVGLMASLTAVATGILVFLFWDVLTNGLKPVDPKLEAHRWGWFALYASLLAAGFIAGLMTLVYYDEWMKRKRRAEPSADAKPAEAHHLPPLTWVESLSPGRRLAVLIATGIGLHNFGEGLAICQSAASGQISLAVVLIIGFGLHNATEGFGIVGPMAAEPERPSWAFLGLMGLIGGGPTFVGTLVGQAWVSPALATLFFGAAAGSILYVVIQLFEVCRRYSRPQLVAWALTAGVVLGFGTDFVLTAAGV